MKTAIKFLSLFLAFAMIIASGCKKDEPGVPDIKVGFKFSPDNPVAGELVTFTNSSNGGKTFAWDFGDGNSSTEKNPTHTYQASGTFTVVLKVDGYEELTATKTVTVQDQVPVITASLTQIEIGVEVTFTATIYNPASAAVTYTWQFPAGAVDSESIDENGVATGESVTLKFTQPNETGGHPVSVKATIATKDYNKSQNFVVKNQLAKTLYYAVKGGNLWMKKLYLNGEAEDVDMGISSGAHPLTLEFMNNRLYLFDAGDIIKYSTATETNVGGIYSMDYDGANYKTHIVFSNQAYDDAFYGCVTESKIYWTDRRNDITAIDITSENLEWIVANGDDNPTSVPRLVQNNELAYYVNHRTLIGDGGPSYPFGALNGTFKVLNGVYWWAKSSNSKGIFKFSDDDIGVTTVVPSEGVILTDYGVRAFAFDMVNQRIYFCANHASGTATQLGFFVADMDGSNPVQIDGSPYDGEGGDAERVYITGIAVDNESGYVYWAYRGPATVGGQPVDYETYPLYRSGIKRFKLDGTGQVEYFIPDVQAYGLTIDHTKR
jgi:PKD repeat protein